MTPSPSLAIDGRLIGPEYRPYVIAELSGNHNGDLHRALDLIDAAKEAGADAVKFQTYTPDTITLDCDKPDFCIKGGLWDGYTLHKLYQWAQTPWEWHSALFERAAKLGIPAFSSPFDPTAIEFLESFNPPAYKVASFEMADTPFVREIAAKKRPIIMSTGMATEDEIACAIQATRPNPLLLLHCISGYPTPHAQSNLRRIPALARQHQVPVGLSDHTLGTATAIAAVALGACAIEKHLTFRRSDGGPDADFSLEPEELRQLVADAKIAWESLGSGSPMRQACETSNRTFRRSLYAVADIAQGELFTRNNVRSIRPGYGLSPEQITAVLGRRAAHAIERGTPMSLDLLAP